MIRLVIFDFSGTLGDYDPAGPRRVFERLKEFNLPVSEEKTAGRLAEVLPDCLLLARNWQEFADRIIQKTGHRAGKRPSRGAGGVSGKKTGP